jgi:hypothetical protein
VLQSEANFAVLRHGGGSDDQMRRVMRGQTTIFATDFDIAHPFSFMSSAFRLRQDASVRRLHDSARLRIEKWRLA